MCKLYTHEHTCSSFVLPFCVEPEVVICKSSSLMKKKIVLKGVLLLINKYQQMLLHPVSEVTWIILLSSILPSKSVMKYKTKTKVSSFPWVVGHNYLFIVYLCVYGLYDWWTHAHFLHYIQLSDILCLKMSYEIISYSIFYTLSVYWKWYICTNDDSVDFHVVIAIDFQSYTYISLIEILPLPLK